MTNCCELRRVYWTTLKQLHFRQLTALSLRRTLIAGNDNEMTGFMREMVAHSLNESYDAILCLIVIAFVGIDRYLWRKHRSLEKSSGIKIRII